MTVDAAVYGIFERIGMTALLLITLAEAYFQDRLAL